jgi:FSR family fosmidomycin resistance protein-like MFS transporter
VKQHQTSSPAGGSIAILLSLSLTHFFNDSFQSLVSASYPVIKEGLSLTFSQIGIIAFTYQICASVFQPLFGIAFDRHPSPWYLTIGTASTMTGLVVLSLAGSLYPVMVAVAFIGLGSSIIHPEASRLTHLASGGRHGLAQSIFQVGGNLGGSIGPLLAAAIIAPHGQRYIALFAGVAVIAMLTKRPIITRYRALHRPARPPRHPVTRQAGPARKKVYFSLCVLLVLIFSKHVYTASLSNFYTFYLIEKFDVTTRQSQLFLFAYLFATALGTLLGGPLGDRFGRKHVIWISILGTAPFSLLMPHAGLAWTCVLSILVGLVLSSAFSAILVYAQELLPTRVGLISGLFFGLAFGIAGIAAAVLGNIADTRGIEHVYKFCAYMPLLGFVAILLPNVKRK